MRATFANPNSVLFPQQFVNVRLLVDTMTGVALAPNAAVQIGPTGNFVYVLNADSTVSKRDVAIGPADGKVTTITKGLAEGDKVVIDGVDRLRDGAKVTLAEAPIAEGQAPGQGVDPAAPRPSTGEDGGAGGGDAQGHRHHRGQGGQAGGGGSAAPSGPAAQSPAQ
jgi:membrane fusion protein, multidrug efflux system